MFRPQFAGTVTPPPDMIDAARKSLSAKAFEELMAETGGAPPTPDQLCAKVEANRPRVVQVDLPAGFTLEDEKPGTKLSSYVLPFLLLVCGALAYLYGSDATGVSLATMGFAVALRNSRLDQITTRAGASALLRFYDGTRPATGGAATNLLAQLTCNATFAAAASSGVLTLNSITPASSAAASGTATWARIVKSDGTTHVLDMSVSTVAAGTGDCQLDSTSIVLGGTVAISSATITDGNV